MPISKILIFRFILIINVFNILNLIRIFTIPEYFPLSPTTFVSETQPVNCDKEPEKLVINLKEPSRKGKHKWSKETSIFFD